MIIYESEQAKANRIDYYRRTTLYRLTNTDTTSQHFGQVMYHTAVSARQEFGIQKEDFYKIVAGSHLNIKADRVLMISDNWEL